MCRVRLSRVKFRSLPSMGLCTLTTELLVRFEIGRILSVLLGNRVKFEEAFDPSLPWSQVEDFDFEARENMEARS